MSQKPYILHNIAEFNRKTYGCLEEYLLQSSQGFHHSDIHNGGWHCNKEDKHNGHITEQNI
jgi:hypothetical protein